VTEVSEQVDGPWLDMSAYPNLAPDDAVPAGVLGVLRDVLRAPEVAPLHPDVWHDVLHATLNPAAHDADVPAYDSREPEANEHEAGEHEADRGAGGHGRWQAPGGGEHTWHGPGTGLHAGGFGGHGPGANDSHNGGSHNGGFLDGGGHG
jgi:hypothetical protein